MRTRSGGHAAKMALFGAALAAVLAIGPARVATAASNTETRRPSPLGAERGSSMQEVQSGGNADRGRLAYDDFACIGCHGPGATGKIGPPLAGTRRPFESFRSQVRTPVGGMISYPEEGLPDDTLADIYAYLRELSEDGGRAAASWRAGELLNLPTPSHLGRGILEVHFNHRFSQSVRDAGIEGFYGLDSFATPGVTFTYGLGDRVAIFAGRTANLATWEIGARASVIPERPGESPISAAAIVGASLLDTDGIPNAKRFVIQIPIGFHLSRSASLLAVPMYATNTDELGAADSDDHSFALGLGGTLRLGRVWSLEGEWIRNLSGFERPGAVDQWQIGFGIKVGGHVFQLLASNSIFTTPDFMAAGAQRTGIDSDIRIGFNLVRLFKL